MKFILVFSKIVFLSVITYSQSYRSGFDKLDHSPSGGNGNGLSMFSNVNSGLHNTESVFLIGYIHMFQATTDKKYLDQFIIHSKRIQQRRDDNITELAETQLLGFPSTFYDENNTVVLCQILGVSQINTDSQGWSFGTAIENNDDQYECFYDQQAPVQSGEITYPMALFVWYMQSDPAFIALQNEALPLEATTVPVSSGCGMTSLQIYADFAFCLDKLFGV